MEAEAWWAGQGPADPAIPKPLPLALVVGTFFGGHLLLACLMALLAWTSFSIFSACRS
jgi:hypothetical protein